MSGKGDETAVLGAMDAEHQAFWMKDAPAFERCHLRSADSLRWGYWQAGGLMIRRGWDEIGPRSLTHMARLPRPVPEFANSPMLNLTIHCTADMAWASFDRDHPRTNLPAGMGPNGVTHNIRILERHAGQWLIAVVGLLDAHLGDEVAVRIGRDCRVVWASDQATERLKHDQHFVLRHGHLYARDRKLQIRLLNAVAWVSDPDPQLMPRRRALPLFFEDDLGHMRAIWIVADLGEVLIMLEDARPMRERIELASQVFSLSPAQSRLALALLEGQSPADYAESKNITLNTTRTHLKRMFEKAGVNNQAGLMRALIALSPPR